MLNQLIFQVTLYEKKFASKSDFKWIVSLNKSRLC